jgi:anti-sigma factor RsiW
MMNHEEASRLLDAYVDGELESSVIREVEAHLNLCPECRRALTTLGALLDEATTLRGRAIAPKRDLWPEIARRLSGVSTEASTASDASPAREVALAGARPADARPAGARPARGGARWRWPRWFGVLQPSGGRAWIWGAAVILVAASLYTAHERRETGRTEAMAGVEGLSTISTESERARAGLQAALKSRGGAWPSEGAAFQQSLQMLDQAIKDSRAAVEANPNDQGRQRSLLMIYQKQLDLLRWATKVVHQS